MVKFSLYLNRLVLKNNLHQYYRLRTASSKIYRCGGGGGGGGGGVNRFLLAPNLHPRFKCYIKRQNDSLARIEAP